MEFSDLLFLIFIALGGLSSLIGGKKKKKQTAPPKNQPRPPRPAVPGRTTRAGTPPGRELQQARQKVSNEMDRILRELGLGGTNAPPTRVPPPSTPPIEETGVSDEIEIYERPPVPRPTTRPLPQRELPQTVSLEDFERDNATIETLDRAGGKSHTRFHDRYIKPLPELSTRREPARVRKFVNPRSLREAMIVTEILGPPKGLQ